MERLCFRSQPCARSRRKASAVWNNWYQRRSGKKAIQVAREARKKEKQDNKQARQDKEFDFKKAEAERAEKECQFKREEAERAHELQKLQFEVNKEMLLFLRSRPPPNPDQNGRDKF